MSVDVGFVWGIEQKEDGYYVGLILLPGTEGELRFYLEHPLKSKEDAAAMAEETSKVFNKIFREGRLM
jgi:hypothetical protein